MIDITKQISYWRNSAIEDWQVAAELIAQNRIRHGLFFAQLSIEKLLKALVCHQSRDIAPRIHNLNRLAEIAKLKLSRKQMDTLADMNAYNIEGRYPDTVGNPPSLDEARDIYNSAKEVYEWLLNQL